MSAGQGKKLITKKRIIKRKPGKKSKNYFTAETQEHIVTYQNSDDLKEKEQLYTYKILPALDSLVENLINVYGYKIMFETKADLKQECIEFLYTTLHKWDPEKGTKAFSYFNVVAKNWLTISSKKNVKKLKTYVSIESKEEFSPEDLEKFEAYNIVPSFEEELRQRENSKMLKKIVIALKERAKTDNEKICINAIEQIVDNLDDIDILNKRAVLLYIREITNLNSKQLSSTLSSIKKHYRDLRKNVEDFSYD